MHRPGDPNYISVVHTDISNFRSIVQKLTGSTAAVAMDQHARKLTVAEKPAFKLQDRRKSAKKLRLKVVNAASASDSSPSPLLRQRGFLVSPVSTLQAWPSQSPASSGQEVRVDEKESGLGRTARWQDPPELLPLFPVVSPRDEKHEVEG